MQCSELIRECALSSVEADVLIDEKKCDDECTAEPGDDAGKRGATSRRAAKPQQRNVPPEGQPSGPEFELELRSTLA